MGGGASKGHIMNLVGRACWEEQRQRTIGKLLEAVSRELALLPELHQYLSHVVHGHDIEIASTGLCISRNSMHYFQKDTYLRMKGVAKSWRDPVNKRTSGPREFNTGLRRVLGRSNFDAARAHFPGKTAPTMKCKTSWQR